MKRVRVLKPRYLISSLVIASSLVCHYGWAAANNSLDKQRELYDLAQTLLDKKQVDSYQHMRHQIADYPLTPYVDYRALLVGLADKTPAEVTNFINKHKAFPFSSGIRASYLSALARRDKWQTFLAFQPQLPSGETYQCHYYYAQSQTGNQASAWKGAQTLWLNGHSVSSACDPLFSAWEAAGKKTPTLVMQRMQLAFDNNNLSLVRYLNKQLSGTQFQASGKVMQALLEQPQSVKEYALSHPANPQNRRLVQTAFQQWSRYSPDAARLAFESIMKAQQFSAKQRQSMAEGIAFRLMDTDSESAAKWRDNIISHSGTSALIERRIRIDIQQSDWRGVQAWIAVLPEAARKSTRWQYWQGRTDIALGKKSQGTEILTRMLGQRDFYSAAAAQWLGKSIRYPVSHLSLKQQSIARYQTDLIRVQELIARNKISAAKSEWRWLMYRATQEERAMLTAYAASKHWYNLTVTGTIMAEMWNNMELRFPLAHQWWFNFYANKHQIDPITLMSVARQESGLDAEARSPVGARGLMQIMPATAKHTADKYQIEYQDADDLFDVGKNIEIGSTYLKELLEQHEQNRIFAFAAYNAGPNRVKQWREKSHQSLDAFAFIETIPFNETRGYVQNILMFETYYRDLLGKKGAFLSARELGTKY